MTAQNSLESIQTTFPIIVTCAEGLESPLLTELDSFGITAQQERIGRIFANMTLAQIYQVCLWSRVASRVLLPLGKKNLNPEYDIADQLNTFAKSIKWTQAFNLVGDVVFGVEIFFAMNLAHVPMSIKIPILLSLPTLAKSKPNCIMTSQAQAYIAVATASP